MSTQTWTSNSLRVTEKVKCGPLNGWQWAKWLIDNVENRRLLESSNHGTEFHITAMALVMVNMELCCEAELVQTDQEFIPTVEQRDHIRAIRKRHGV